MAITVVRPADWQAADLVEVESDAPDNTRAVIEIEAWAGERGLLRTRENWLNAVLRGDRKVFRAICYRPTPEEIAATEGRIRAREGAIALQAQGR